MKEIDYLNKISNLEAENERLKLVVDSIELDVINAIKQFWCWYNSGSFKRDFSKAVEGEKYARDFIKDLIKELSEE